jgi:hypothetical protein
MSTESFSVRISPKTVANKALAMMRRAKLPDFKLKESGINQQGDGFVAAARWEEGGFFGSSAELRVEARKSYSGGTEVVITSPGDRCVKLVERLRKNL